MKESGGKEPWKQRLRHELGAYLTIAIYLGLVFGVFTWYRRLILESYQISYREYGFAVIKALVLAKVIMIGDLLHLERQLRERRLIIPTLYNTCIFTLWAFLFMLLESTVTGFFRGEGVAGVADELFKRRYEIFANSLVVFCIFIPFFAFRELARVMGEGKMRELFFKARPPQGQ